MRVDVYIDAFNLYYGGRGLFGRGTAGWKWLDPRRLVESLIRTQTNWTNAHIKTVTYCTARISGAKNESGQQDQDVYLRALKRIGAVSRISYGNYVSRVTTAPLAVIGSKNKPVLVTPSWPLMIQDRFGEDQTDVHFMASIARREEKGTDVNVASHLLIDVLTQEIDAAVIISNDSDLAYPIQYVRNLVHVGLVNPTKNYRAGKLAGNVNDGVGGHWWYQIQPADWCAHQMPEIIAGRTRKPSDW